MTAHLDSADAFQAEAGSTLCILCDVSGEQDSFTGAQIHVTDWVQSDFDDEQLRGYDPEALNWPHVDVKNHFKKVMPLQKPHLRLTGVFDRPVSILRVRKRRRNRKPESPIAALKYPSVAWKLRLECGMPSSP